MASSFTFSKHEKLCSKRNIEKVFQGKKVLHLFPFSIYYQIFEQADKVPVKIAFGVSKKTHKKATDRNRIKRLMREAFRLNKGKTNSSTKEKQLAIILVYHAKQMMNYEEMELKWKEALIELNKKI